MKVFTTNQGHEIEAENLEAAFAKAIEKTVTITAEIVGCPVKVHETDRFNLPLRNVKAARVILVPDLPEFVTIAIRQMPELTASFAIMEGIATGEKFEILNPHHGGQPFIYSGEWQEVATRHAYFIAGCKLIETGGNFDNLFITDHGSDDTGEVLYRRGNIICGQSCEGSVNIEAVRIP